MAALVNFSRYRRRVRRWYYSDRAPHAVRRAAYVIATLFVVSLGALGMTLSRLPI